MNAEPILTDTLSFQGAADVSSYHDSPNNQICTTGGAVMARARNIKPGFFTNDELAEVEPLGRLLFAGLWTIADREGRLEDRPKRIKAEVLPYDDCDVDALLSELERHNFVQRYTIGECRYINIIHFTKHQNPHVKEAASIIPAPDEYGANGPNEQINTGHGASTVQAPDEHGSSPADSGFPLTDSLNRIPDSGKPKTGASPVLARCPDGFERFWSVYPRRTAKQEARKSFNRINPDEALLAVMLAALESQKGWPQWVDGVIPHPATWLNGRRWEDEPPPSVARASPAGRVATSQDSKHQRMLELARGDAR